MDHAIEGSLTLQKWRLVVVAGCILYSMCFPLFALIVMKELTLDLVMGY